MSMMSDGGGGSIFGPIHGGTQGALGGQIRDESLRATVAELGRKVEEIRRILSNFSPETITTQGSGTTLRKYRVLASPAGSETVELPEDAPPLGEGQSLLDWVIDQIKKIIDVIGATVDKGLQASVGLLETTVALLRTLVGDPENLLAGSLLYELADLRELVGDADDDEFADSLMGYASYLDKFNEVSITLCIDGTPTPGKILFRPD